MNIGVFGTGVVGQTIAAKLVQLGHNVVMGTRDVAALKTRTEPGNYGQPSFVEWHQQNPAVKTGTYADAAVFGEILFNCTSGHGAIDALKLAGESNLNGKVLIDIANPLDFSQGFPPSLSVSNTDSLGEQIQRAFPNVRVVKSLNTVTAPLMVDASLVANGDHTIFVAGNDAAAKAQVTEILKDWFHWQQVIDLGDITNARGTEAVLLLWVRLMGALGTGMFNFKVVQ
jgi:predicted dinucleotide-binding enzyme